MLNATQLSRLQLFFNTAYERHKIYLRKENGQVKPWTDDPVFQNYRFCNVFRRLDKTSVWMIENIFKKHAGQADLWKYVFLSRYVNNIETLTELEKCETFKAKYLWLRRQQAENKKIFGNAFIVNSKGQGGTWQDKVSYIFTMINYFELVDKAVGFENIDTIESMFYIVLKASGVGNFMAYQYTMDFTYLKRYLLHAPDQNTFTVLGIGAVRGMNRVLYGEPRGNKIKGEIEIAKEILELWKKWLYIKDHERDLGYDFKFFYSLHLCDVEHWLCEYDKYCRGGSKKRRYPGV